MAEGYFANDFIIEKYLIAKKLKRLRSPVDAEKWEMTPMTVNAYFNPSQNEIGKFNSIEAVVQRCPVKTVLLKCSQNSERETPVPESLFNIAGLRPATLLKKRPWHRCFHLDFGKFLRTLFH